MENLTFGNIAIATVIVGIFDLIIVMLVRTETILKAVERIKGVIKLDYKSRAKRSDEEIKISKRHELVARERVRNSFIIMEFWNCKWTWNWSKDLEPINIKGFCTEENVFDTTQGRYHECNHPVAPYFLFPNEDDELATEEDMKSNLRTLAVQCSNDRHWNHDLTRVKFQLLKSVTKERTSVDVFNDIVSKVILGERDLKIAKEIQKLKKQFWR